MPALDQETFDRLYAQLLDRAHDAVIVCLVEVGVPSNTFNAILGIAETLNAIEELIISAR
jgi:hypothetical protein